MEKRRSALTKAVGAALIFLTVISTAVVVAKSCHDEPQPVAVAAATIVHASHGDHVHTTPAKTGNEPVTQQGVLNSGLISDICTGIFYLVLFLGGRFLLKSRINSFREQSAVFTSIQVFNRLKVVPNLTLSLPQLGISRI